MIEPRRLREEGGSALELALLDAGRRVGASTRTRTRALAALGLAAGPIAAAVAPTHAVGAALAAGSAAAPAPMAAPTAMGALAAKLQFTTTLGKLVAGLSLAGVTAAVPLGTMAWRNYRAAALTAPAAEVARSGSPDATSRQIPTTEPEASTSQSLGRELAALDTARLRLAKRDTSGALEVLDDYSRQFPNGRLALEAEVVRIDALAKSGRSEAAKARATAFLHVHPGSVLAPRVRAYLDD
jgi:hypothetical protein